MADSSFMRYSFAMIHQLFIALALMSAAFASDPQPESLKLATDAAEASNIFSTGKAVKLAARIRQTITKTTLGFNGPYALIADGTGNWRDEIDLGGYMETRVGSGDSIYRFWPSRTLTGNREFAENIRKVINLPATLLDAGYRASSKPKKRKLDGRELTCFDTRFDDFDSSTFCFDDANRLALFTNEPLWNQRARIASEWPELVPLPYSGSDFATSQSLIYVGFSDFTTFHDKWYPRKIELRSPVENAVVEITTLDAPSIPDGFFDHNDRFTKTSGCLIEKPPVLLKKGFPPAKRAGDESGGWGDVTVRFVIGTDGATHDAKIIQGGPFRGRDTIDYINSYRYRPAECNGTPVPVERTVVVRFDGNQIMR